LKNQLFIKYKGTLDKVIAHPGFRKYFFNTSWVLTDKLVRLIAALFVGAFVARYLGPDQYGLLNYVISIVSIFGIFASLGLDQIVTRQLIRDSSNKDLIIGTAFLLRVTGAIAVLTCLHLIIVATSVDHVTATLLYIIGAVSLFESFLVMDYYFQSQVLSKYTAWSQLTALILASIARVFLVLNRSPLWLFALTYLLDFVIVAFGLLYFYSQKYNLFKWRFSLAKAKELLFLSWPIIVATLTVNLYMKIDQVIINWMLGNSSNGIYGVAVRLTEVWYFVPMVICNSLFPSLVNSQQVGEDFYLSRMQMLLDLMVAIAIAIAIPTTFLSGFIIELLFGSAYAEAGPILSIYIWSGVFVFLGVANQKWIINENMQRFQMVNMFIALMINVVLNYFLIKKMGLVGSALATLIAQSYSSYFSFLYSKKTRVIFRMSTYSLNVIGLFRRIRTNQIIQL
jgi:O-antigen/teichoic acid export membrane protein